jgi:hypothetical protein
MTPVNKVNSRVDKSIGSVVTKEYENPNITFNQDLKKKVGPIKYKKDIRKNANIGKKSKKNEKNKNSATKNIEPGKPKNTKVFKSIERKSFGHK